MAPAIDIGDELVAERREADRLHADRVVARAAQHAAEARADDAPQQQIGADEQRRGTT